jgi:hypothetical protein
VQTSSLKKIDCPPEKKAVVVTPQLCPYTENTNTVPILSRYIKTNLFTNFNENISCSTVNDNKFMTKS